MKATSRRWPWFGWLLALSLAVPAVADNFEKTTAYFVIRYGLPETTKKVTAHAFLHGQEKVSVEGRFSVREYRHGDLQVEAVFMLPHFKLVAVTLRLPRAWTPGERDGALAAYGSRWWEISSTLLLSSEGVRAIYRDRSLFFVSPEIAGAIEQRMELAAGRATGS
jgi:hypothetical protein